MKKPPTQKLIPLALFAVAALGVLPAPAAFAQAGSTPTVTIASADADASEVGSTPKAPGVYRIPGTTQNSLAAPDNAPAAPPQMNMTPAQKMPMPIHDDRSYSMTLFDLLEYRPDGRNSDVNWDIESWRGGDYRRFVLKTEGNIGTRSNDYYADLQLLSSRLRKPYTELQYGLRLQARRFRGANVARPQAVLGLESRVPYNFDIETALYLDPRGKLSGDFTATKDILLSQRLILQSRLEAEAGLQNDERFGVGAGLRDASFGLRLRYEIKREFAPYIGISYGRSFGKTATYAREDGGENGKWRFAIGVHAWY